MKMISRRWRRRTVAMLSLVFAAGLFASQAAAQNVNVMTSTEDLAALVREVGGSRVQVESIARGYQDPHYVEAKPSFLLKLSKADLLVLIGLQLEVGWLPRLVTQSRNSKIQVGAPGYLDASTVASILEKPTGPVTRAMGDVHPLGNPHYWLEPSNGRRIAQAIQQKLSQLDPPGAAAYAQQYQDFDRRLTAAEKRWDAEMAPLQGTEVITYHNSWPNFSERFGFRVVGYVEPKPGIPPPPSHILAVIQQIRQDNIQLILVEPYFDEKTPQAIARQAGAQVVTLLPSVGGVPDVKTYFDLFDYNIRLLKTALNL